VKTDVLIDALAAIERDPSTWNQGNWARKDDCGTAYCLAGHIVNNAGYRFVWYPAIENVKVQLAGTAQAQLPDSVTDDFSFFDVDIASLAMELLGVEEVLTEHDDLFGADNDLYALYRIGAELAGVKESWLREQVAAAKDTA
jgi:hypothetical protein